MPDGSDDRSSTRSPLDIAGGIFLIGIGVIGYLGALSLPVGHLSGIGSGLMPKTLSVLVAVFGVFLIVQGLLVSGPLLDRWAIRAPFFVLGSVIVFALTIRSLGLIVAGPLAMIISALADRDTRPIEIAVYAIGLTVACIGMFKFILRLPMPIFPPGYGPF
jgi:putative tricarboxylic transport membrane protein